MDAEYHPDLAALRTIREWREEHEQLRRILQQRPHTKPEADRARELDEILADDTDPIY